MDFVGIDSRWAVLCVNFVILAGWPGLALLALFSMRGRGLAGTAQAIWVLIIVAVPVLGPLAYWIIRPDRKQHTASGQAGPPGK